MALADRDRTSTAEAAPRPVGYRAPDPDRVRRTADALLDVALEPIVDLVVTTDDEGYDVRAVDGRVRFRREADTSGAAAGGTGWRFVETRVEGRNPLADTATDRFASLADEIDNRWPARTEQSYPHAHEHIAQLFDHPAAPDLVCLHTAAHNWEDHGGERGEHGSLGIVQVRAPFVLAGAGVRDQGLIPRSCRLVDVAPTVLALLGAEPTLRGTGPTGAPLDDALVARQDGRVLTELLDPGVRRPDHVIGFLWDGTNANVLYDMLAAGEVPHLARLLAMGTGMGHGAMASLPSVTLANHTTILTGAHPGHHGVLHNAWYDRSTGQQVVTNSPVTWPWSMQTLSPQVETIHQAVHRAFPGARTVSINEPCDVGADYSTFEVLRTGGDLGRPPRAEDLPFATERFVRPEKSYEVASRIDHTGMVQALDVWDGARDGRSADGAPLPRFTFVNFTLTDAAFHQSGPYADIARASIHDSDARLGQVLDAVERSGAWDRTAFFLVADHGMEDSNPEVTGDWAPALASTGIPHRDEAYGFIYVDV
ncbi:MAG: alkaline phosphatase family protein [Acidimicrobiales bacterium]|nr:alkaline phosphatase family protein [Acidimicrobiales bacterium]